MEDIICDNRVKCGTIRGITIKDDTLYLQKCYDEEKKIIKSVEYCKLSEFEGHKIQVLGKYILIYNDFTIDINTDKNKSLIVDKQDLDTIKNIKFNCVGYVKNIKDILLENNLTSNVKYAEIAAQIGNTIFNLLQNNISFKYCDAYETNDTYCKVLNKRFNIYKNINIFPGNAENVLPTHNKYYNVVFIDASHKYETDKKIIEELLNNHINKHTIMIFHDYNIPDVKRNVKELLEIMEFDNLYVIENNIATKL